MMHGPINLRYRLSIVDFKSLFQCLDGYEIPIMIGRKSVTKTRKNLSCIVQNVELHVSYNLVFWGAFLEIIFDFKIQVNNRANALEVVGSVEIPELVYNVS